MVNKEIDEFGNIRYYNEQKQLHREDGPAVEYANGDKYWYLNNLCHRIDGPAVDWVNGEKYYYLISKKSSYEDWLAIKDFQLLW